MTETLEKLVAAGIELVPAPELETHWLFTRDGFVCLVEKTEAGFGRVGSPGKLTESGFAALVWNGSEGSFQAKGHREAATAEDVVTLRRFADDLKTALGQGA